MENIYLGPIIILTCRDEIVRTDNGCKKCPPAKVGYCPKCGVNLRYRFVENQYIYPEFDVYRETRGSLTDFGPEHDDENVPHLFVIPNVGKYNLAEPDRTTRKFCQIVSLEDIDVPEIWKKFNTEFKKEIALLKKTFLGIQFKFGILDLEGF